jgi:hypothetical protein
MVGPVAGLGQLGLLNMRCYVTSVDDCFCLYQGALILGSRRAACGGRQAQRSMMSD